MKANVEARVKAVMSDSRRLQAELDGIQDIHDAELAAAEQHAADLQQQLDQRQQHLKHMGLELSSSQQAVTR